MMKRLLSLCVALVATIWLWAGNVITYTATAKLTETSSLYYSGLHTNAFDATMSSHIYDASTQTGTITFGSDITQIKERAFYGCSALISITIPESVTSIGNSAFNGCRALNSITIPEGVTSISEYAFSNCSTLTSVTIPEGVMSIGYYAFNNCKALNSIMIPEGVTSIDSYAFYGCSALTSITIPSSLTGIGNYAFPSAITEITFGGTKEEWDSKNYSNLPTSLLFVHCTDGDINLAKYKSTYSDGTEKYENSISNKSTVVQVEIRPGVTSIISSAFYDCSSLTSVTIPNSVTSIGNSAFNGCRALNSITIPNSVTSIGERAFYGCSGLTSITIPNSVTSIGERAFSGCSSLTSVHYTGSIAEWCRIEFTNSYSNPLRYAHHLFIGEEEVVELAIPEGVTSIGNYVFYGCSGLTAVTIPNSVTSIGIYAFSDCTGLTAVTIPNSVTSIGIYAFSDCTGLTSITIPEGVTSIDSYAFYGCSALTSITIPSSLTSIGNYAFPSAITEMTFGGTKEEWDSKNYSNLPTSLLFVHCTDGDVICATYKSTYSDGTEKYENWISNKSAIVEVEIMPGVTSIGNYVFLDCSSLTSITIPNSVTSIEDGAFESCSGLTSVHYTGSIAEWCRIEFANSYSNPLRYAHHLFIGEEEVVELAIPEGVTSIGNYVFYGCSGLTSITIPNSVTSIGSYAFYGCSGLTAITIPNSMTSIGSYAFYGCSALTSITIPSSVTSIEQRTFGYCSGLTSITIPNSVTSIGDYAFFGCSGLTSITIPNSVTSIERYTFQDCAILREITFVGTIAEWKSKNYSYLPNNLIFVHCTDGDLNLAKYKSTYANGTIIYENSISNQSNLVEIEILPTVTNISSGYFANCTSLRSVIWNAPNCTYTSSPFSDWASTNGNTSVTSFTIGDDVLIIPRSLCERMTNLTSLTIGRNVSRIEGNAFKDCTKLTSVTIPENVSFIDRYAFSDCKAISSIVWNAINCTFTANCEQGPFYDCRTMVTSFVFRRERSSDSYWIVLGNGKSNFYSNSRWCNKYWELCI